MPLSTVKAVTYKAADGTTIPAYLTLPAGSDGKNLPTIVMPHGGPASRDEWGFDWLSQFFAGAWLCRDPARISRVGGLWRPMVQ